MTVSPTKRRQDIHPGADQGCSQQQAKHCPLRHWVSRSGKAVRIEVYTITQYCSIVWPGSQNTAYVTSFLSSQGQAVTCANVVSARQATSDKAPDFDSAAP